MASKPIEVTNVIKAFGDVRAVDGISLSVGAGEMFGLIGHNGAGKSTLFKLMLGLIKPTSGQIRLGGEAVDGPGFRQVRRRIGYLPETFAPYDNLTGTEVLQLFADLKKVPRAACAAVLERVGLSQAAASRRVAGYSKGMRQRLGFAQVLLGDPDLIFLDEPTNGLDPEGIHEFYGILRDVQARGATIVITSHILAEIQGRVDRVAMLDSGKVAAVGSLAELRRQKVLPSHVHARLAAGNGIDIHAAFGHLAGVSLHVDERGVRIACPPGHKVAVLGVLAGWGDAVDDIAVHEPSLEDLFLNGGNHVRAH
jgi:Cu-processing system ATP-binding protein